MRHHHASFSKDAIEQSAMRVESERLKQVIHEHEERAKQLWQDSYVAGQQQDLQELQEITARNDQDLEASRLQALRLADLEAAAKRHAMQQAQQLALHEQANNPLGLYATPSAPPMYGQPPAPTPAVPQYVQDTMAQPSLAAGKAPVLSQDEPPPYDARAVKQASDLFVRHATEHYTSFEPDRPLRCASCFDPIERDLSKGHNGRAVSKSSSTHYHEECYVQHAAPRCAHCSWTLNSHPTQGLSGAWGEYRGKQYHVECYQYYAGPRCRSCFDVIFANPEKGYSGNWRSLASGGLIHEECFTRCYEQQHPGYRDRHHRETAPAYAEASKQGKSAQ